MPGTKSQCATSTLQLRTLTPDDFETIYEIDQVCYPPEIAYSRRELRWYLRLPGADGIVAERGARIAGFLLSAHWESVGHIITIDVLERFRRAGTGSALVRESEARLARQGVTSIEIETAVNNPAAIAFWNKHGYLSRGILKNYYPGGLSAYAMIKPLSAATSENSRG
ncbi:MAG: N-acetyltransferase [Candidatus Acidiferrales bacterium]|jgi:ribosomal-protein-alanine N-acetyltransferase